MQIYITIKNEEVLFYAGYGQDLTGKGLGSGALTGTNRKPIFTRNKKDKKILETFTDVKRITGEIIDAIRYKEIESVKSIEINFKEGKE